MGDGVLLTNFHRNFSTSLRCCGRRLMTPEPKDRRVQHHAHGHPPSTRYTSMTTII